MKRVGNIAIWLAAGLLLSAGARADNPYTPVVERNIFGLKPAVDEAPPGDPPPKITLNGIMSTYGKLQVLFKVAANSKAGQTKDQSYMLGEGQRQDDIEVTRIDDKASLVTFNNHGVVQEIPLANAPAATGSAPGQGAQGSFRANFQRGMGGAGGGNATGAIGRGGGGRQSRGAGNNANQNLNPPQNPIPPAGGGSPLLSIPTRIGNFGQQEKITPEAQIIMMEIYREQHKNDSTYPTLPPTMITPPDTKNPNGTPAAMPDVEP
jgi:hypothetical protein